MTTATYEDDITYASCPVLEAEDAAAMSDQELAEGYDYWSGDHDVFDWEAGINTRRIRTEIVRRVWVQGVGGDLRKFAETRGLEEAA
jgi:hypothetical protein